ncbi:MAG: hypothetical protein Q7S65_01100 [Nanoarchaeota archaeon]|nr:hypothetical protein [Nanoarchaeota archaeon]
MEEIVMRRVRNANNEEIIELDLNQSLPLRRSRYPSYMDEVDRLAQKPEKEAKQFITVLQGL